MIAAIIIIVALFLGLDWMEQHTPKPRPNIECDNLTLQFRKAQIYLGDVDLNCEQGTVILKTIETPKGFIVYKILAACR